MSSLTRPKFSETTERKPALRSHMPIRRNQPIEFFPDSGMLQRKPACACGGGCPRCQAAASSLKIGEPDDAYEREADAIADKVMRMAAPSGVRVSSSASAVQGKRADCTIDGEKEQAVQFKAESSGLSRSTEGGALSAPPSVAGALRSPGQSLDAEAHAFFGPRFGRDFSHVRVHADDKAAESAKAVNARAYTLGQDVVFAAGQYAPQSEEGKRLLAHELAHVVQQDGEASAQQAMQMPAPAIQRETDPEEVEDENAQASTDEAEDAGSQDVSDEDEGAQETSGEEDGVAAPGMDAGDMDGSSALQAGNQGAQAGWQINVKLTWKRDGNNPRPLEGQFAEIEVLNGGKVVKKMSGLGGRRGVADKKGKRNPKDNHPTHVGSFTTEKCDPKHISTLYKVPMPNFVRFNGAEGFHKGSLRTASHGCIHLSAADAEYICKTVPTGTDVKVS